MLNDGRSNELVRDILKLREALSIWTISATKLVRSCQLSMPNSIDCASNTPRQSLAAGKTAEQAMSDFKLPDKFKDYTLQGGRGGPGGNFNIIFQELQKK
jgi:hypothetical protein